MNLVELSQRLKQIRLERELTLEHVARLAGQTRSWLSKVENFRITPSLLALSRLAQALEVPISQLVDGLDAKPKIVKTAFHERSVLLRDEHQSSIRYTSLCRQFADRAMDPFILDVPPGGGRPEAKHHEGEEFLVVLSGKVKMHYAEQEFDLDSGDSLYFDAMIPHRLWNDHSEPAQVLCVFLLR